MNSLKKQYLFKECKKCPVKSKKKIISINNQCHKCIEIGKAVPPPKISTEIKY